MVYCEIIEGEDEVGDGEWEYCEEIEDLVFCDFGVDNDIGDGNVEEDVDDGGDVGEFEVVGDGWNGEVVVECDLEVF